MKKIFDNTEEFNKMLLEKEPKTAEEQEAQRLEMRQLLKAYTAEFSQYTRILDTKMLEQIKGSFYPVLCRLAEECGGRVEFDFSEKSFDTNITYTGDDIYISNVSNPAFWELTEMLLSASSINIYSTTDNLFRMSFNFSPYRSVKTSEFSPENEENPTADMKILNDLLDD